MMNDNVTIKVMCMCVFVYRTTQAILSYSNNLKVRLCVKGNLALESGITGHVHLLFLLVHGIIFSCKYTVYIFLNSTTGHTANMIMLLVLYTCVQETSIYVHYMWMLIIYPPSELIVKNQLVNCTIIRGLESI